MTQTDIVRRLLGEGYKGQKRLVWNNGKPQLLECEQVMQ
jgi:hypothetical protein